MTGTPADPKSAWAGDFGAEYTQRNVASDEALRARTFMWGRFAQAFGGDPPKTILEVGCNLGLNLRVMPRLLGAELSAIEPNATARRISAAACSKACNKKA